MKRDDWMLLSLTFLTGLAIGMYVYIAAYKPIYAPADLVSSEASADEWSIVGKQRGGNEDNDYIQPSFRILADGSYTYLPGGTGNKALQSVEGSISRSLLRDLQVSVGDLNTYSKRVTGRSCASDVGGYDYRYRVTMDGDTYLLDTCSTLLGDDSGLAVSLSEVWDELSGKGSGATYNTVSDWAQAWIRRNLRGE